MYEYDSRVRLSEVGEDSKMTLNAVLNCFQDCSSFHSEDLGVGIKFLQERKRTWVLNYWKIVIYRYPELAEEIKVATWPYQFSKMTGQRNFNMLDKEGKMVACADTLWVYMNTERMRPARIDEYILDAYTMEDKLDIEEEDRKMTRLDKMEDKASFLINPHHLDVNHHVNNGQYVQLAKDYLPEAFPVHEMRAEYKKSAMLGDMVYPKIAKNDKGYLVSLENEEKEIFAIVEFR